MYEDHNRTSFNEVLQTGNASLMTRLRNILRARQARIHNPLPDPLLLNVEDDIVWSRVNHDVQVRVVLGCAVHVE